MISYAQNYEDVLLARAFRGRDHGFYIDVGAWHPVQDSVTKHFYDRGWQGINLEPSAEYFGLLAADRPRDINLQIAAGERREVRRFYRFAGSGLSTFSPEHVEGFAALGLEVESSDAEVVPLREICAEHVRGEIDFLKIDVEGWEEAVIRGADWERYRPRIVLVEAVAPNPQAFLAMDPDEPVALEPAWEPWQGLLGTHGYDLCYDDGLNRFYLRQEDRALREAFRHPPNIYDRFEPYPMWRARQEIAALTARGEELRRQSEEAGERLRQVLESRSWRAAAPLRALSRLLTGKR